MLDFRIDITKTKKNNQHNKKLIVILMILKKMNDNISNDYENKYLFLQALTSGFSCTLNNIVNKQNNICNTVNEPISSIDDL
jgi:hypothetical protein